MSANNYVFQHGQLKAPLNPNDFDVADKFDIAFETMRAEFKAAEAEPRIGARFRLQDQAIRKVFDTIFGDGAAVKALGEQSKSLEDSGMALNALVKYQQECDKALGIRMREGVELPAPPNRAARRAAAKGK